MSEYGFIGLGTMGMGMVLNMLKADLDLMVYDIDQAAIDSAVGQGAKAASSVEEMATNCSKLFIMVNTLEQVKGVMDQIENSPSRKETMNVCISSTLNPNRHKEIAAKAMKKGILVFDAPVSGGPGRAQTGDLSLMIGGTDEQVAAFQPAFDAAGKASAIFHVGEAGAGQAVKLINNLLGISNMMVTGSALRLGMAAGLDLAKMSKVLNVSSGHNGLVADIKMGVQILATMFKTTELQERHMKINEKDIRAYLEYAQELGVESVAAEGVLKMVASPSPDQIDPNLLAKAYANLGLELK